MANAEHSLKTQSPLFLVFRRSFYTPLVFNDHNGPHIRPTSNAQLANLRMFDAFRSTRTHVVTRQTGAIHQVSDRSGIRKGKEAIIRVEEWGLAVHVICVEESQLSGCGVAFVQVAFPSV